MVGEAGRVDVPVKGQSGGQPVLWAPGAASALQPRSWAPSRYLYEVHFAMARVVRQVLDDDLAIVLDPPLPA